MKIPEGPEEPAIMAMKLRKGEVVEWSSEDNLDTKYTKIEPIFPPCSVRNCPEKAVWYVDAIDKKSDGRVHTCSCDNPQHKEELMAGAIKLVLQAKKDWSKNKNTVDPVPPRKHFHLTKEVGILDREVKIQRMEERRKKKKKKLEKKQSKGNS